MKILALDSSGLVAGVAVTEDDNLLGEYTINYKKTHSQTLLPMLDEVAKMIELDLNTIDVIAVSAGPGSFTGLRIGSATAKGLALALNKQIVSVPTVDALAYNLWGCEDQVCPLMDARRQQAYTGLYTFSDGQMQTLLPQCVVGIDEITAKINESGKKTVFLGDGVPVFADYLKENYRYLTCLHLHIAISSVRHVLRYSAAFYTVRERLRMQLHTSRIICACRRRKENARKRQGIFAYENTADDRGRHSGCCTN